MRLLPLAAASGYSRSDGDLALEHVGAAGAVPARDAPARPRRDRDHHATPDGPFERPRAYTEMPITSIHAPAPLVRHDGDRANTALNLPALDDTERDVAIPYAKLAK